MKYTKELLQQAVNESNNVMDVLRQFDVKLAGGTHYHVSNLIKKFNIDTAHFTGRSYNKGRVFKKQRKPVDKILIRRPIGSRKESTRLLVRALLDIGRLYKCENCDNTGTWNGNKLTLQVDHIDGDPLNNLQDNLRFLCPNCHSQTDTFGVKNVSFPDKTKNQYSLRKKRCSRKKTITYCPMCGNIKKNKNKHCSYDCSAKAQQKVDWDNIDLVKLLLDNNNNFSVVGRLLGISGNAVRKRLKVTLKHLP